MSAGRLGVIVATDVSEDEGKDSTVPVKETEAASTTDSKSTNSNQSRKLSVREKAAAFLENTAKDSVS